MPRVLSVDLALLRPFDAPGLFTRIDPEVERTVCPLSEVCERIEGVVLLAYRMRAEYKDSSDAQRSQIFFRAALSEFVSMEEAAAFDFARLGYGKTPRIDTLPDPRLHVVRLLRHANVHLIATKLSSGLRPAVWEGPNGPQEFDYLLLQGEHLTQSVSATEGARRYQPADLSAMTTWLVDEQSRWGMQNVVVRAAEEYARVLAGCLPKS